MKVTIAELLDRYAIEYRKFVYGFGNRELLNEVIAELSEMLGAREFTVAEMVAMILSAGQLGVRNADIANCEWQIRVGQQLPLEEIGRRALLTRKINDERCKIKQNLSDVLQENKETRHFGYGEDFKAEGLTLDVQEPVPSMSDGPGLRTEAHLCGITAWTPDKHPV